ncbi:leucine-rich repeat domain-containing protein [Hominisplanchenecus murintestinalis]|uniref:Leucine-rich repeat domain-containing protein n=1 Tax=Hominisplanchenecus murintestinalis TaxID=2941517 RepID=A0AC61QYS0_9FIRM|nr:leucine-rich repeat domain-containing protein [Hominisplanchenecus murintestinalis]TGX98223.1 leucine-rich repeat domain-containing protein [Hominisplanchenecus murintestinalis]
MEIRKREMKFITTLFVAMAFFMLCETGDVKAKDAYHERYDGWVYSEFYSEQHGGKVVQITGSYEEKSGNIIIPETINGYPVTEMANGSDSYSWGNIETITLPKSLIEIESSVFSGCTDLRSVEMPNSVTKIGYGAFEGVYGSDKCRNTE